MKGLRRALLFSAGDRYICLAINFITIAIISRLLTPAEIGVWAAMTAIMMLSYSFRDFATANYLIPPKQLTREHIRTTFTVMLMLAILIAGIVSASAPLIASFYEQERLASYLWLIAISMLFEPVTELFVALLRREMSFGKVAIINVTKAFVNSLVTISLALIGFGYMSFAWGLLCSAAVAAFVATLVRSEFWVFWPMLLQWREMLRFGVYNGANVVLYRLYESIPPLLIGRMISFDAAGLYNRAFVMSQLPDRVLLGGVLSVALPAFSAHARERSDLRRAYLGAVELITGVQWPALVVLAILAYPAVSIFLGSQWAAIVPLVQIIALGWMFSFAFELNYPLLQSIGALRDTLLRALIAWPISLIIITVAVFFGLRAVAFSYWITIPLQAFVAFYFVRRHIGFSWSDLASAMKKSGMVTVCSAAGPTALVAISGFDFDMGTVKAMIAGLLAAIGWLGALCITKHPLLSEIETLTTALRSFVGRFGLLSQ